MPLKLELAPPPFLTVRFADGITAASRALAMNTTYEEEWLSGGPDAAWTADYFKRLQRTFARELPGTRPYIVPVEAQPFDHTGRPPDRAIQILPRIRLSAIFTNAASNYFDDEASPSLFIIWHQHDLTNLMPPEIEAHLSTLDWVALTAGPSSK
jgi:hypothetical protein